MNIEVGTTGNTLDPGGVHHPRHYNLHPSGVEAIEVMRYMSCDVSNAFKYMLRAELKEGESELKNLNKAMWYINDAIESRVLCNRFPRTVIEKCRAIEKAEPNIFRRDFYFAVTTYGLDPTYNLLRNIQQALERVIEASSK